MLQFVLFPHNSGFLMGVHCLGTAWFVYSIKQYV